MGMFATGINFQFAEHGSAQFIFWHHPFDSHFNYSLWRFFNQLFKCYRLDTTGKPSVMIVSLVGGLVAGDLYLFCVHDDDIVTRIHMRRVLRLVLTAESVRNLGADPTEGFVRCIDEKPTVLYIFFSDTNCFHHKFR